MGSSGSPVSQGEEYTFRIEEFGREGDGIAYVDGFVIVVPDAGIGEWVTVEIETVHDTFAVTSVITTESNLHYPGY